MKERVFRYRAVERRLIAGRPGLRALDVGCGRGDNLRRLARYGARPIGLEPAVERARAAAAIAPAVAAIGERIPLADGSFDLVYVSHVLHHARDVDAVLRECRRVLVPGGLLFAIETVDDSPLMRLARALQPRWDDDEVLNRFRYAELRERFEAEGFEILGGSKFNWMYFGWELLPLAFRPLELLTPLFVALETSLHRPLGRVFGGHCWLAAVKPGGDVRFALEGARERALPRGGDEARGPASPAPRPQRTGGRDS